MPDKLLELAQAYAKAKGTAVLDFHPNEDGTITIILVSGPKLRLTPEEIQAAVDERNLELKIAQAQLDAANAVVAGKSSLKFLQKGTEQIKIDDGVDDEEATLAAKALQARKAAAREAAAKKKDK